MKKDTAVKLGDIAMKFYNIAEDDENCKEFALDMMKKISSKLNSERDKE